MQKKFRQRNPCSITKWMQNSREHVSVSECTGAHSLVLGWDRPVTPWSDLTSKGLCRWVELIVKAMVVVPDKPQVQLGWLWLFLSSYWAPSKSSECILKEPLQAGLLRGNRVWYLGTWTLWSACLSLNPSSDSYHFCDPAIFTLFLSFLTNNVGIILKPGLQTCWEG